MMPSDQWLEEQFGADPAFERISREFRAQQEREETQCQLVRRLIAQEQKRETGELIDTNQCMGIELCDVRFRLETLKTDFDELERKHSLTVLAFITMVFVGCIWLILEFLC